MGIEVGGIVLGRRRLLQLLPVLASLPAGARLALQQAAEPAREPRLSFVEVPLPIERGRLSDPASFREGALETAAEDFFVKTPAPAQVLSLSEEEARSWPVRFDPGADASGHFRDFGIPERDISAGELADRSRDLGVEVCECVDNDRSVGFGRLAAARWSGVPLQELFEETMSNLTGAQLVSIRGVEATWITTVAQVRATGAFLATGIGGRRLTPDLGAPVRLVVPGWYGCSWIKWVQGVEIAPSWQRSTPFMERFAEATFQEPAGDRPVADFAAPEIDLSALPVRVSGPDSSGTYEMLGVRWGGRGSQGGLEVRLVSTREARGAGDASWTTVSEAVTAEGATPGRAPSDLTAASHPARSTQASPAGGLHLWRHSFRTPLRGDVRIELRVADAGVQSRRLDRGDFDRLVKL